MSAKILGFGANNRLEQVSVKTGSNHTVAAYQYNAKGQRVRKQVDGKTIHFHYDTENRLLAETTENGAPIREYIYAGNQRIAVVDYQQNSQGVVYFMVNDHLGTPQLLLDAQQQVVWSVDQSPFGEMKVDGNIEQPLRFPGQYADAETGYSYNYFRDYDPTLGRYIESDPIGLEAGVNTFGYVMGNPLRNVDVYGLTSFSDIWNSLSGGTRYNTLDGARYASMQLARSAAHNTQTWSAGVVVYKTRSDYFMTPASPNAYAGMFYTFGRDMVNINDFTLQSTIDGALEISLVFKSRTDGSNWESTDALIENAQSIADRTGLPVNLEVPGKDMRLSPFEGCKIE